MTESADMRKARRQIRVERGESGGDGIVSVVLDRPERRNALNAELVAELAETLRELDTEDGVRVIALRGAGKDFCAGADLAEVRDAVEAGGLASLEEARALGDLFVDLRRMRRPVVAVVQGRALAGGCGLATACDLVLAAESAAFGYPEVRLGFVPAMVMAILRRSVGETRAFELVSLGRTVDARVAAEYGLVNRVFADAEFEGGSRDFLRELSARSASAVSLTKQLLYQIDGVDFEAAIRSGSQINALARLTDDCRAGINAFLDKKD